MSLAALGADQTRFVIQLPDEGIEAVADHQRDTLGSACRLHVDERGYGRVVEVDALKALSDAKVQCAVAPGACLTACARLRLCDVAAFWALVLCFRESRAGLFSRANVCARASSAFGHRSAKVAAGMQACRSSTTPSFATRKTRPRCTVTCSTRLRARHLGKLPCLCLPQAFRLSCASSRQLQNYCHLACTLPSCEKGSSFVVHPLNVRYDTVLSALASIGPRHPPLGVHAGRCASCSESHRFLECIARARACSPTRRTASSSRRPTRCSAFQLTVHTSSSRGCATSCYSVCRS